MFISFTCSVTADSCIAMNQWVKNPTAHTALDDILPCVDNVTAQETMTKSKEVTTQLVNVVNQVISNVSNSNFSSSFKLLYFNQSGPLLPILCNPYYPDFTNRTCAPGEVDLSNATEVHNYLIILGKFFILLMVSLVKPNAKRKRTMF